MGLFSFLQNEIQGAGNYIDNHVVKPVSSTYQSIATPLRGIGSGSISQAVPKVAAAISPITHFLVNGLPNSSIPGWPNPLKYALSNQQGRKAIATEVQAQKDAFNKSLAQKHNTPEMTAVVKDFGQRFALGGLTSEVGGLGESISPKQSLNTMSREQAVAKTEGMTDGGKAFMQMWEKANKGIEPPSNLKTLTKTEAKLTAKNLEPTINPPQGTKDLGLVKTIKESPQSIPTLQTSIEGKYDKISNPEALAAAQQRIASDPNSAYHFAATTHSAEGNATAILLAKHFEENGQADLAANLMVNKAKQALQAGQGNQIYSMWDKLSPETVAQTAAKTIEDYNQLARNKIPSLSPEQYQDFVDQAKQIQQLPEGRDKGLATQKLQESIGKLIPSSTGDKIFDLYRTGLLTGFRTPGKIVASHAVSNIVEAAKNIPSAVADQAMSVVTGKRSLVATPAGAGEGFTKGFSAAVDNLIHGYETPGSGGMAHDFTNKVHFNDGPLGKVAQTYVDTVSRLHGSLYKPFYGAQHLNSLYDMALTNARNQGLSGTAADAFVSDFVKKATDFSVKHPLADPHAPITTPESAAMRANAEAQYTTFQNKTKLSEMASGMKGGKGNPTRYITPFTQIPSSIAMKLIDYSPIGAIKEAVQQIGKGEFDQRALAHAIGRSVTGTGIMYLGKVLYDKGMMTLGYPSDQKTQQEWQLEGRTANSILVNGKWRQLATLGPAGDALAVGGNFAAGMQGNKKTPGNLINAGIAGLVGGVKTISDSPYLQGLTNVTSALNDPVKNSVKVTEGLASSIIPTGFANAASAFDPYQRQTNGVLDAIESKIPGARENLLPKVDAFGQQVPRSNDTVGSLFDPFYSSQSRSTPFTNNLDVLAKANQDATPLPIAKSITQFGYTVPLTPAQQTQLQQKSGQLLKQAFDQYYSDPQFQSADPLAQKQILDNATTNIKAQVEKDYIRSLGSDGLQAAGATQGSPSLGTASTGGSISSTGNITTGRISGGKRVSSGRKTRTIGKLSSPKKASIKSLSAPHVRTISLGKPKSVSIKPVKLATQSFRKGKRASASRLV